MLEKYWKAWFDLITVVLSFATKLDFDLIFSNEKALLGVVSKWLDDFQNFACCDFEYVSTAQSARQNDVTISTIIFIFT